MLDREPIIDPIARSDSTPISIARVGIGVEPLPIPVVETLDNQMAIDAVAFLAAIGAPNKGDTILIPLMRPEVPPESVVVCGGRLIVDSATRLITLDGEVADLTVKEFDLLEFLVRNRNKVHERSKIYTEVWDHEAERLSTRCIRTIDVHVGRVRKCITPTLGEVIRSVRGIGYGFIDPSTMKA